MQLVQQAGPRCDSFNFATAVSRIAKLHRQQPRSGPAQLEAFSQLLRFAAEQQLVLGPVAVGQTVHAAAVLQYRLTAAQQQAWEERLVAALPAAEAQTVANALWGWSKLCLPLAHHLAAAADAAVQRTTADMKPQEVSNTLWAFASGGWELNSRAAAALLQRLEAALPNAKAQEVASSLWALAKRGLPLEGPLAAAADAALQRTAAAMKPQEVANTLWAFATGSWQLSPDVAASLMQRLEAVLPNAKAQEVANSLWALAKRGLPLEGPLAVAAEAAVQRTAASMQPQSVSNTLWAFASGRWQLSTGAAPVLLNRLEAVLPTGSPHSISSSLWALAKLGLPLEGPLAAAADAALQRTAVAMNPQDVSNTLWAFASSGWQLSPGVAASLMQQLEAVLPTAKAEVASSLWALAKRGLPLEGLLAVAAEAAVQRTAASMQPQDVSNTLWAFASGRWQLSPIAAASLVQRLEALLPNAKGQPVANSLWALATLAAENQPAAVSPALLDTICAWADARWPELPAVWVCDLCYNLARLGAQPSSAWIDAALARGLECFLAGDVAHARFATLLWACSRWQHRLEPEALWLLIVAAVDNTSAEWRGKGRRGGLRLLNSLAQQPGGFSVATAPPAAAAALQDRLLPLLCSDIDLVASLAPEGGELNYLAACASACAAVGLRLPPAQLEAICRYIERHPQQLERGSRANLQRAFEAWGHLPGVTLLAELPAVASA